MHTARVFNNDWWRSQFCIPALHVFFDAAVSLVVLTIMLGRLLSRAAEVNVSCIIRSDVASLRGHVVLRDGAISRQHDRFLLGHNKATRVQLSGLLDRATVHRSSVGTLRPIRRLSILQQVLHGEVLVVHWPQLINRMRRHRLNQSFLLVRLRRPLLTR